jgi:hypothetical protein
MNILANIKESLKSKPKTENRILIPRNQTKISCQNHTVVFNKKKHKVSYAIVFSNPEDLEYECECGTIYERSNEVEEEY